MGGIGSKLIQSASSEDLSLDDSAMTSRKTDGSTCNPSMGIPAEEVPSLTRSEMKLMFDPRSPTSDFTRTPIAIDVKETEHGAYSLSYHTLNSITFHSITLHSITSQLHITLHYVISYANYTYKVTNGRINKVITSSPNASLKR